MLKGTKLNIVDVQEVSLGKARAILPPNTPPSRQWSLAPSSLRYVRPTVIDLTRKTLYGCIPSPGTPGLRLSHTREPGLNALSFRSDGWRTAEFLQINTSLTAFVRVS